MLRGLPPFNNADEILPNLWLGNARAASDATFLKNANIQTVFNCTKDLPFHNSIKRRYRVPVEDNLQEEELRNMELWSYEIVVKLMNEYKAGRPILVHCHAGMQRSPAVIAMVLIAMYGFTTDQAIEFIQQKRPIAFKPGPNFQSSIQGFEASLRRNLIEAMIS